MQTALFADVRILFEVKPGAFLPPPKVDSAVVLLEPRARELGLAGQDDREAFLRFAGHCFRQKRKMLRNNLRPDYPIDGHPEAQMRAEQLSLKDLADLWSRLRS